MSGGIVKCISLNNIYSFLRSIVTYISLLKSIIFHRYNWSPPSSHSGPGKNKVEWDEMVEEILLIRSLKQSHEKTGTSNPLHNQQRGPLSKMSKRGWIQTCPAEAVFLEQKCSESYFVVYFRSHKRTVLVSNRLKCQQTIHVVDLYG